MDARMVVIDHGYVGLAPVPGNRVNVGIVLGKSWVPRLRAEGGSGVARAVLEGVTSGGSSVGVTVLDRVAGSTPLGVAARRRGGKGWLLIGDAAGFLDPFTGEGLGRAIVSAELAAEVIATRPPKERAGRPRGSRPGHARPLRHEGPRQPHHPGLPRASRGIRVRGATAGGPTRAS